MDPTSSIYFRVDFWSATRMTWEPARDGFEQETDAKAYVRDYAGDTPNVKFRIIRVTQEVIP